MKMALIAGVLAVAGFVAPVPAAAAPTQPLRAPSVDSATPDAELVHWRAYRHCHDRGRRIRCHGGYVRPWRGRYGYAPYGYRYGSPGFVLRFGVGPRYRYNRRWR